jgi:hypothetical protein
MNVRARPTPPRGNPPTARVPAGRRRGGPRVRVERIVLLRALAAILVVAFLALIVKASILAFGTSEQQATRIDRAVDGAPNRTSPAAR